MRRRVRLLAATATAVAMLTSCSSPGADPGDVRTKVQDAASPPGGVERYAALGDSFTAGPLIPTTDLASGCFRSSSRI